MRAEGGSVGDAHPRGRLVGHDFGPTRPRDGFSGASDRRRIEAQQFFTRQDLGDPAAPDHHVSLAHEEVVAAAVEQIQAHAPAAIVHVVEESAVRLRQVDGSQDFEIGGKLEIRQAGEM